MRKPISPDKRLAMALRFYATGGEFSVLADNFGVGVSTFRETVFEVTEILIAKLPAPSFPTTKEEVIRTALEFDRDHTFPDVVGTVDGSHIPINAPLENREDYWCYKKFYSIILLAVCNAQMQFTFFDIGCPGKECDGGVYKRCELSDLVENLAVCTGTTKYHLLGDKAFTLSNGLMKPFSEDSAAEDELVRLFNYLLSSVRMLIECSFGILKERFRCLKVSSRFRTIEMTCKVTTVCVLLHNFLIEVGDPENDILRQEVEEELNKNENERKKKLNNPGRTSCGEKKRKDLLTKLTGWRPE